MEVPGSGGAALRGGRAAVRRRRRRRHRVEGEAMTERPKRRGSRATCLECGTAMRSSREPHRYTITPDWAVTIADAEVRRCPKCGAWEVVIPKPDALQRTIAAEVIRK